MRAFANFAGQQLQQAAAQRLAASSAPKPARVEYTPEGDPRYKFLDVRRRLKDTQFNDAKVIQEAVDLVVAYLREMEEKMAAIGDPSFNHHAFWLIVKNRNVESMHPQVAVPNSEIKPPAPVVLDANTEEEKLEANQQLALFQFFDLLNDLAHHPASYAVVEPALRAFESAPAHQLGDLVWLAVSKPMVPDVRYVVQFKDKAGRANVYHLTVVIDYDWDARTYQAVIVNDAAQPPALIGYRHSNTSLAKPEEFAAKAVERAEGTAEAKTALTTAAKFIVDQGTAAVQKAKTLPQWSVVWNKTRPENVVPKVGGAAGRRRSSRVSSGRRKAGSRRAAARQDPTQFTVPVGTHDFRIVREFDAPRELVFRAYTDPSWLKQWLGPRDIRMHIDVFEPYVGGRYRYIHFNEKTGLEAAFHGVIHELDAPRRIIQTWEFEGLPETGHVMLETAVFDTLPGKRTRVTSQSVAQSVADRDGLIGSGMADGVRQAYERLDELLEKVQARRKRH